MKVLYNSILISLLLLITIPVISQTPLMRYHSLFKGKENYNVSTIYQDPRGWIWMGTDRGLFRFDGVNYSWFTVSDSLANDNVTAIHMTEMDILWIGHIDGKITLYDGNTFRQFKPESGLGNIQITDIVSDSSGVIWYSTKGEGLFRWDGKYLSNLNTEEGISDNYIYDIEIDNKGIIWLATDNGITKFINGKCEIISMKDGLPDNIVRVLKSSPDGKLWIGTEEKGISLYNPENKSFKTYNGWDFGPVTGLTVSPENEIWAGTERNNIVQFRLSDNSDPWFRMIRVIQGNTSARINTVALDMEENIWVGGERFVTQLLPPLFEFLNRSNGTPFEMCYSLITDRSGNLWVCSEKNLFRGIPDKTGNFTWFNLSEKLGTVKTNFISVFQDHLGMIWAGTYGDGVYRINPDDLTYRKYTTAEDLSDNNVISISGSGNNIWFSTLGGGVSCFNTLTNEIRTFHIPELKESYIYSTRTDNKGKTWIAGSLRYPSYIVNDSLRQLNKGLRTPQLYGVAFDTAGGVWFNTVDKGLLRVYGDSIKVFGKKEGIDFDNIQSIVFDKMDNLLVISNLGLLFYKPGEGVILEFGENTGLSYQYPVLNSVFQDSKGQIWIGTETGIIRYNPDYLNVLGKTPRIFLSEKISFYDPIEKGRTKFRYLENSFTFGYTGIWFSNPEGLKYRYMLKGNDRNWTYSNRNQTREYSNLSPGEYTFISEVSLDDKNWHSSADSVYSFEIYPPLWRRWWFISAVVFLMFFSIYSYIRLRIKRLEKDKEVLEEEVHKRTEEIRKKNMILEEQKIEIGMQRDIAEAQRDKIEAQKEEIQSSIRYAHRIQSAALPPKKQLDSILKEYFILYKPCEIVSGDFYWVARNNTHIFFAAGDCTGHGVPGSFMSMLGLTALNDIVKSLRICRASVMLDQLREKVLDSLHQVGDREMVAHDGIDISLCILENETCRLQFAGAHNSIYILRNNEITFMPADKIDIGSSSMEKLEFTNHELQCEPGDIIYLFTDGYADQFGGPKRKKYKYQRFKDTLLAIHKESMEDQRSLLDREIEAWRGNFEQTDDILVMGVKIP